MNSLPSKDEVLAFQQRWQRRAGFAAVAAAFITVASVAFQQFGLHPPTNNSNADALAFFHAHASRLVLGGVIQGIGLALFAVPLVFLFRAASYRSERMRPALGVIVGVGPVVLGIAIVLVSLGSRQASNDFVSQAPAKEQAARQHAAATAAAQPKGGGAKATTGSTASSTSATTTGTGTTGTTTAAARPQTPAVAANNARQDLADHLSSHGALIVSARLLQLLGAVGFLFAFIYTPMWAMRTGLLTRGMGYLGIASGVLLVLPIIPKVSGLVFVVWSAVLGLMFLRVWIRPLPPAWAAGVAIPWQRPGDDLGPPAAERGPAGTVEGSGREVSEPPLPEPGGQNGEPDQPPEPPYGETQGQRRKKRKRRS